MTLHEAYDIAGGVVMGSSLLYSFLPTVESFNKYPRFQAVYAFFMIFVVKFASVNVRNLVHPNIVATEQANLPPQGSP